MTWTAADSASLYGVNHWGDGYFFVNDEAKSWCGPMPNRIPLSA